MAYQKMKLRNSVSTLTGVLIALLIVMGMFFVGYDYLIAHADSANVTIDSKYGGIYQNLSEARDDLNTNIQGIKNNVVNITEAGTAYGTALNGLKLLGNTLTLPITFLSTTLATWEASVSFLDFLPGSLIILVFIGLFVFIVLLVLKILKGETSV